MISIILLITSNKSIDSFEAKSKRDKKPNIIFILSDDHTTNAISAYGSIYKEIAPTPNTVSYTHLTLPTSDLV